MARKDRKKGMKRDEWDKAVRDTGRQLERTVRK